MNTDSLIESLARDVRPVPRNAVARRLLLGVIAGGTITVLLIALGMGFRSDLGLAMHGFTFWMKWAYTISLGFGAISMVARLARPEPVRLRTFWPVVIPFILLSMVAIAEMAHVPPGDWLAMWLGHTWKKCPWLVLMLSAPIFMGLLWSFRSLWHRRGRVRRERLLA